MSNFRAIAINAMISKVNDMLDGDYFDVCSVRKLVELLGGDMGLLDNIRHIHCVHWDKMPEGTVYEVIKEINRIITPLMDNMGEEYFYPNTSPLQQHALVEVKYD